MSQTIQIAGATYPDVPSILVPKQGGGSAVFADPSGVDAVAADVASGKIFMKPDGTLGTGTASGGGGASNIVTGTFKGTTANSVLSVNTGYSGNGYPIGLMIWLKEGTYNSDGTFYKTLQRYAVAAFAVWKNYPGTAPTYPNTGGADNANGGTSVCTYKSSASTANTLNRSGIVNCAMCGQANPSTGSTGNSVARFSDKKTLNVLIAGTSYGFMKDIEYKYCVVYSS